MKTLHYVKAILALSFLAFIFTSCTGYGKKVKVEGTKGEVYYKGDSITEADAQKLGNYLKGVEYFDSTTKSVQLLKTKGGPGYDVRFVVDEMKLKASPTAESGFVAIGTLLSKNVFNSLPVNIYLADETMKDIKTILFDKAKAEALLAEDAAATTDDAPTTTSVEGYTKKVAGGITFYWKSPVTDAQAETIAPAIIGTNSFTGGSPENTNIFLEKQGERFYVKYIVSDEYINQESTLAGMEAVAKKIKDAAFPTVPYSFIMVNSQLKNVKSWDY